MRIGVQKKRVIWKDQEVQGEVQKWTISCKRIVLGGRGKGWYGWWAGQMSPSGLAATAMVHRTFEGSWGRVEGEERPLSHVRNKYVSSVERHTKSRAG